MSYAKHFYVDRAMQQFNFSGTGDSFRIDQIASLVIPLAAYAAKKNGLALSVTVAEALAGAAMAIHTYFQDRGYVYVHTPLITCADCEGSDQMFKISTLNMNDLPLTEDGKVDFSKDLFGKQAFITGSGQLQGETFAMAFGDIYTFGPTFRTENSNTQTHANEFWMIEPEMAFCDLEGLMDIEEDMLKFVVKYVCEKCPEEIDFCDKFVAKGLKDKLNGIINAKFTRICHHDAIDLLKKADVKWEFQPDYGEDIAKEHEKYLVDYSAAFYQ